MASPPAPSMGLSLVPNVSFPLWDENLCRSWRTAFCSSMGELAGHPCSTDTSPVPRPEGGPGPAHIQQESGPRADSSPAEPAGPSATLGLAAAHAALMAAVLQVLRGWEGAAATGWWPSSSSSDSSWWESSSSTSSKGKATASAAGGVRVCAHSGLRERRCSDLSLVLGAPRVFPILPSAPPPQREPTVRHCTDEDAQAQRG